MLILRTKGSLFKKRPVVPLFNVSTCLISLSLF